MAKRIAGASDASKIKLGMTTKLGATAVAIAGMTSQVRQASADFILTLSEPGYTPQVVDVPSSTGLVRYASSYGTFATNFDFGLTNQIQSSSPFAYLQIQSFEVDNVGANGSAPSYATLSVDLQVTDPFTFPGGPTSLVALNSSAGGTLTPSTAASPGVQGDYMTFQSFAYPTGGGNISTGVQSATIQPGGGTVTVPLTTAYFTRTAGFTLENTLNFGLNPNEVASINGSTNVSVPSSPVPEPASVALLATGALACLGRRRRV